MKKILLFVILVVLIIVFVPFIKSGTVCPTRPPCYESRISLFNWIRYRDNLKPANREYLTYKNSDYGFQLTLPNTWNGYKVFSSEGSQGVGSPHYFDFSMPTSDTSQCVSDVGGNQACGYASIFSITAVNKDRDVGFEGEYITQDEDRKYIYRINRGLPNDLKNIDFSIPKVISTFRFNQ